MKQGCLILFSVIVLCFLGYRQLFIGTELAPMWWIPLLLGISAAMFAGNFQGIIQSLRQLLASKRSQMQWREGDLVVLSGRLQALKTALIAPISGKPATILEYEINRISKTEDSQSTIADYRGCLMVPCAIHSMSGQVNLVGFPLLVHWKSDYFGDPASYQRIAKFLLSTKATVMPKSPLAALAELNKVLKDDDGEVQANYRNADAPDLQDYSAAQQAADSLQNPDSSSADSEDQELVEEEREFVRQQEEFKHSQDPTERIIHFLRSRHYSLKETTIENGCEVTVMGTYRSQKRQIDIGSGLSKLTHGIYKGPASQVLGKNLRKALILTLIFLGIFLTANYFVLKQIGINPQQLFESWQNEFMGFLGKAKN